MELRGGRAHVQEWVNGVFSDQNMTAVGQCLNDIESMTAWDGAAVTGIITGLTVKSGGEVSRVYHVSSGKPGTPKTCTLFFIRDVTFNAAAIIGVYQHIGPSSYQEVWSLEEYGLDKVIVL